MFGLADLLLKLADGFGLPYDEWSHVCSVAVRNSRNLRLLALR